MSSTFSLPGAGTEGGEAGRERERQRERERERENQIKSSLYISHLNIFPLSLIIQDMSNLLSKYLLSPSSGMDTYHCHSNRPWSIAYCHLEVDTISFNIFSL